MSIINVTQLNLIDYEGAGNRTPVLDITSLVTGVENTSPSVVRHWLETDVSFRQWLQLEGRNHQADSVMIFYRSNSAEYDFVTFIGEPGGAIDQPFSDMCGNGIRNLALHIMLSENELRRNHFMRDGIAIHAGEVRRIFIEEIDYKLQSAQVRVNLGLFQSNKGLLSRYVNNLDRDHILSFFPVFAEYVSEMNVGLNGNESGEPHLAFLFTRQDYSSFILSLSRQYNERSILEDLRKLVCELGNSYTFNTSLFPLGINVNVGVVIGDEIYMATHERNMNPSRESCTHDQKSHTYCNCNTMACGTGGAVMSNVAFKTGLVKTPIVITHQPGGDVRYNVSQQKTVMIGPAKKLIFDNERKEFSKKDGFHEKKMRLFSNL